MFACCCPAVLPADAEPPVFVVALPSVAADGDEHQADASKDEQPAARDVAASPEPAERVGGPVAPQPLELAKDEPPARGSSPFPWSPWSSQRTSPSPSPQPVVMSTDLQAAVVVAARARKHCVVLSFRTEDDFIVEHTFTSRPIGMDYHRTMPISVRRAVPGTAASEKGLRPGLVLVAMNGQNVETGDYTDVSARLKELSRTLPLEHPI